MVIFCRVRESFLLLSIHGSPAPEHQFYPTASCEVVSKQHGRSFEGANAPGRLGDGERRLALYDNPRYSPDRKSIAVTVTDPKSGADDIWVYPVAGDSPPGLVSDQKMSMRFGRENGKFAIRRRPLDGRHPEETIYTNHSYTFILPIDWSRDRK